MSGSRERSTSACVWVWPASCSAKNSPVRRSPVIRSTFFNIHVWAVPGIGLTKAGLRGTEAVRYYFFIENFTINVLNPSQVYNICPTREIAERSSELQKIYNMQNRRVGQSAGWRHIKQQIHRLLHHQMIRTDSCRRGYGDPYRGSNGQDDRIKKSQPVLHLQIEHEKGNKCHQNISTPDARCQNNKHRPALHFFHGDKSVTE